MRRVAITDIMRETGLSRATVDRVLNDRGRVHPRTRAAIEETLRRLSEPASTNARACADVDFVLRLGRGMAAQLHTAWMKARLLGAFQDLYQATEEQMLDAVRPLCEDVSRPLVIAAKSTDRLNQLLQRARERGKRIVAFISDLAAGARDGFVGIDNRAAGQTSAFLIGRALGERHTLVGIVLGDPAFRCHEDREIGFRSLLRAEFPKVLLAGEALGEDNPELTRAAVVQLLKRQPGLSALYNVGAGNQGVIDALREAGRAEDMVVIGHEATATNAPLLRERGLDFVIAQDPARLLGEAVRQAISPVPSHEPTVVLLDFGVYTRFNLPAFAHELGVAA